MTNYREILRLYSQGLSQRSIAASCECGKSTVQRTITRAEERGIAWPLPTSMTDEQLKRLLSESGEPPTGYKEPDYEQIHRELRIGYNRVDR